MARQYGSAREDGALEWRGSSPDDTVAMFTSLGQPIVWKNTRFAMHGLDDAIDEWVHRQQAAGESFAVLIAKDLTGLAAYRRFLTWEAQWDADRRSWRRAMYRRRIMRVSLHIYSGVLRQILRLLRRNAYGE